MEEEAEVCKRHSYFQLVDVGFNTYAAVFTSERFLPRWYRVSNGFMQVYLPAHDRHLQRQHLHSHVYGGLPLAGNRQLLATGNATQVRHHMDYRYLDRGICAATSAHHCGGNR